MAVKDRHRSPQSAVLACSRPPALTTMAGMSSEIGPGRAESKQRCNRSDRDNRSRTAVDTDAFAAAIATGRPFVASAALGHGIVTRYALKTRFRRLHPDVYVAADKQLATRDRIRAAGLWAPPDATITGWAAAHLYGEEWYSARHCAHVIDVHSPRPVRPADGVRVHASSRAIPTADRWKLGGLWVVAPVRAAVDVARWTRGHDLKICAIDSICNSASISLPAVEDAAGRMVGQHGVRAVADLLPHCDPDAQSPQETETRLRIARSGLPKPTSQLEIFNEYGQKVATADLGYKAEKVAIFYDGRGHSREAQWLYDVQINAELADLGWEVVRLAKGMLAGSAVHHIERALDRSRRKNER